MTYAEVWAGSVVAWACRGCGLWLEQGEGYFIIWRCAAGSLGQSPWCAACAETAWEDVPWGGPVELVPSGEGRSLVEEVRQRRRAAVGGEP